METKKYQLPKEFATKWVEALRSGKYKQGKGQLKAKAGYCCLGVACRVAGITTKEIGESCYTKQDRFIGKLPKEIIGMGDPETLTGKLSRMNDEDNVSFSGLADWIETNVEFV